jgi:uncharacterized protein (DUF2252 family)
MCSQVHAADRRGEMALRKRLRRSQVAEFFRQQVPCLIGIEATQDAHYWARVLRGWGHEVRLVAPQFVKPYLKSYWMKGCSSLGRLRVAVLLEIGKKKKSSEGFGLIDIIKEAVNPNVLFLNTGEQEFFHDCSQTSLST